MHARSGVTNHNSLFMTKSEIAITTKATSNKANTFIAGSLKANSNKTTHQATFYLNAQRISTKPKIVKTQHLTSLFLEKIKIPIVDHSQIAHQHKFMRIMMRKSTRQGRKRANRIYELSDSSDVGKQIIYLADDYEFITEISIHMSSRIYRLPEVRKT